MLPTQGTLRKNDSEAVIEAPSHVYMGAGDCSTVYDENLFTETVETVIIYTDRLMLESESGIKGMAEMG